MNSVKPHIVIVTSEFPPQPGGIGNHAYHLALYLSKQNLDVQVIADQRSETGKEEAQFDATLPFSITRIKRQRLRFKMYIKRMMMTRNSFKKATYMIATGKFSLWNVGFLSLFSKVPTLAVVHGTEVNFKPFLLRKSVDLALKRFDKIVAVSQYTKQLMSHLNKNIDVIPNGINVNDWQFTEPFLMQLKGNPVLTTVGRVSSRKGQLNVIKQLPELIKTFPDVHYHCIGIPTEADAFIEEAKRLKVDHYITFHGSLATQTLKQMLALTDVFVMLSSEDISGDVEGFGIAILEANALGVPAIGSKGCGIEDAIQPNQSGELVDFDDSKQFKTALERILSDKNTYQNNAKNWAKRHDWAVVINQYLALVV